MKRAWLWVIAAVLAAGVGTCAVVMFVPYEEGPWHQTWTVTVANGGRTEASTGLGLGRCGAEGDHGASVAKQGALERACFAVGLCPGDTVCDCASRVEVQSRCEEGQSPGRTRAGDLITVPVH